MCTNQVCYTSGKVLCVHLRVLCLFSSHPSQCREPHGNENIVYRKSLAAVNLNVCAPRDCHLLPSRVRDSPSRDIMLLWHCSTTHLVSGGVTTMYVRCTLIIGMFFFRPPKKMHRSSKMLLYHTHTKDSTNKFFIQLVRFHRSDSIHQQCFSVVQYLILLRNLSITLIVDS